MISARAHPAAGPSSYSRRPGPSTAVSSSRFDDAPASPTSNVLYVQALHDFDPKLLASTNGSNIDLYVPFKTGEVIRVWARDNTGWWDGEVTSSEEETRRRGRRRGWFPSNYVRVMGDTSHGRSQSHAVRDGTSTGSQGVSPDISHSRSQSSPTRQSFARMTLASQGTSVASSTSRSTDNRAGSSHRTISQIPQPLRDLLHPVVQSLSLLETAIHSRRRAHIQPSTACVISAVRATLLQTDCLNKSSPVLTEHPSLGKERKIILIELSKLVGLAKAASVSYQEGEDDDGEQESQHMEALAQNARTVFTSVKRFIVLASDFGVEPIPMPEETQGSMRIGEGGLPTPVTGTHPLPASFEAKSATVGPSRHRVLSGNRRLQEAFKSRAASFGELRAAARPDEAVEGVPPMPRTAAAMVQNAFSNGQRSASPKSTTFSISTFGSSASARSSPTSAHSAVQQTIGSVGSGSTESISHSPVEPYSKSWRVSPDLQNPMTLGELGLVSPDEIMDAISHAEEALVSMVAALIGHIHSLHVDSHPSLRGILIEMTCTTVDRVRDVLVVVEAVGRDPQIHRLKPRETALLLTTKENMYEASIRLVDSVELVGDSSFPSLGDDGYDKMKRTLLNISTATLRAGTDCVRSVKACITERGLGLSPSIVNVTPRQSDTLHRQLTPHPAGLDAAVVLRERAVGHRGQHTLSTLHRKASSLSVLHKKFQDGAFLQTPSEESVSLPTDDEDEEVVADSNRDEDLTVQPGQGRQPFPPKRPSLVHTHTSPLLGPPAPRSAGLVGSFSDDTNTTPRPRPRSSSLSSPLPPNRIGHRSPSRSADLDKFTSDYDFSGPTTRHLSPYQTPRIDKSPVLPLPSQKVSADDENAPAPTTETPQSEAGVTPLGFIADGQPKTPLTPLPRITTQIHDSGLVQLPEVHSRPMPLGWSHSSPLPSANTDVRFWVAAHDYDPREITFNSEGDMVGASLSVIVEKMTPHDGPVDRTFWSSFFITFRMFTTPAELLDAVIKRFSLQPPPTMAFGDKEQEIWMERKVVPVQLRIYNFLKSWLDSHWREETDDVVLDTMEQFVSETMSVSVPAMAPRLLDVIHKRQAGPLSAVPSELSLKRSSGERFARQLSSSVPSAFTQGHLPPTPQISKSLNSTLQRNPPPSSVNIMDFDPLELARQLTLCESNLFRQITPDDLLLNGKKTIPELKALSTLSNQITGWVADNVLNEHDPKKRASLLKFYIKLADKCLQLQNFSTLFAVMAGLNSSIVQRLKKTWDALQAKYKILMERLQGVIDHSKNHAAYRARLRDIEGPCLPFLGLILTDITFTIEGNPDTRPSNLAPDLSLLNYDKYAKLGRIVSEFNRYQEPFHYHQLDVVQTYLHKALAQLGSGSLDALYRKSLMLEPRQGAEKISSALERPAWLGRRI